ncbi:3-phosphoshikimate 1-carboxyvinyltransferase [Pontimonas salivibrio]|uniref:3-phosphoshikimate 1-carboxyvinyltransferase n=1 Tax=Pontimonas salivibrio TaxID=1159327 RepID=UPI000CF31BB0|nr:3-phosphoshikimate 1-carboxyvinyltransferase [Pontimonas salivibrio]
MGTENHSPAASSPWQAPVASKILDASVELPGSKSLTNRELVLAALASGPSTITGGLRARDTDLMIQALEALGATIKVDHTDGLDQWRITPISFSSIADKPVVIDCGLAGTVMRFVPPMVLLGFQPVKFQGDEHASHRPMSGVLEGLRQLGAEVYDQGTPGLPFEVQPGGLPTTDHTITIDASASSQFVSGLLLTAPRLPAPLTIAHSGATVPSLPHIEMTLKCLADRGVPVESDRGNQWRVTPHTIKPTDVHIEPDLSNAAPFLAAALVAGGQVAIHHWPHSTTQVGGRLPELLKAFGALVEFDGDTLMVQGAGLGPGLGLEPVSMDLGEAGELAPTLITLSLFSNGTSTFRGIAHLRGHETNRLAALVENITSLGGVATETSDGIIVTPAPLHGGVWKAFGDHRMATSGALVGLAVTGVEVDDIDQTAKTLPGFVALWSDMLRGANQ